MSERASERVSVHARGHRPVDPFFSSPHFLSDPSAVHFRRLAVHIVSDDGDKGYCFLFIYIYKYLAGVCQAASVFSKRAQLVCRPGPLLLPVLFVSFPEQALFFFIRAGCPGRPSRFVGS